MARLPRFRKIGVRQAPAPQFDYANLREGVRVGTAIQQQVDRMSDFIYKKEARAAEQRGIQLASEQGALPTLKNLAAQGGPKNIEDRAAFETANRIASAEIETSARNEMLSIITNAELNKTPMIDVTNPDGSVTPGVRSQLQDVVDGFPAALADLDPVTAGLLRAKLGGLATDSETRYSSFYSEYQLGQAQGRLLEAMNIDRRDLQLYAAQENATPEGLETRLGEFAQKMRDLQFDEDTVSRNVMGARADAAKAGTRAEFMRLTSVQEQRDFIENLRKRPIYGLDLNDTQRFANSLESEINTKVSVLSRQGRDLVGDIKDQGRILSGGGFPSDETVSQLEARLNALGPEFAPGAAEALRSLKVTREFIGTYRKMTPGQLSLEVNALAQGIPGEGQEGKDTQLEVDLFNTASKLLNTINTRKDTDPLRLAAELGHIDFVPLDFTVENFDASIKARVEQARTVAGIFGNDPMFLTEAEADALGGVLSNSQSPDQMQLLGTLVSSFGNDAPDVLAQIATDQPNLAHIGGLVNMGRLTTAKRALDGLELLDGGAQMVFRSEDAIREMNTLLKSSLQGQPGAAATTFGVAKGIYAKKAIAGGFDDFKAEVWTQSVNEALGFDPVTGHGGIDTVRDHQVIIPQNMNANMLEAILEQFGDVQKVKVASGSDFPMDKDLAEQIAEDDEWFLMLDESNRYFIAKQGANGSLFYATDINDDRVIIDVNLWQFGE